jgi:hypothetical protein
MDKSPITSDTKPMANIIYKEYDKYILLFGSMFSMGIEKNLNHTSFVLSLIEEEEYQDLLLNLCGNDSFYDILLVIFNRYPRLCNSKTISYTLKKNARRIRKKHL